jgi:hypothetical protein
MIDNVFSPKQREVLTAFVKDTPKKMVLDGAKRAGKTYVCLFCFIILVKSFKNKGVRFILGGNTYSSIRRNVLDDLEALIGRQIALSKDGSFELFGNRISVLEGSNKASYKKARGLKVGSL